MFDRYRDDYDDPKANAQRNLSGRTHYVDNDTLRFFKSRILFAQTVADGLGFAIIEAVAMNRGNTERGYRPVVFDICGTVVDSLAADQCLSTRKAAESRLEEMISRIDFKREAIDSLKSIRDHVESEIAGLSAIKGNE